MAAKVTGASAGPARRRPAPKAATPVADAAETPDRTVLMVIDGIECTVRPDVPFNAVLQYMDDVLGLKFVFGQLKLARRALTEDAYRRLLGSKVTRAEWQELCNKIVAHAFGPAEEDADQGN